MAAVIPVVRRPGGMEGSVHPGDVVLQSKTFSAITTAGAGVLTAAAIAGGLIRRTGPTAAYNDTFDSADAILKAYRGNAPFPESMVGLSGELYIANGVAFASTFVAGRGIILGTQGGSTAGVAASGTMDLMLLIRNDTPEITLPINAGSGNTVVTFTLPPGMTAFKMGPAPDAVMVTVGMSMTSGGGTALTAGTLVSGIRMGQGGIIGVTASQNIPAGTTSIIFSPTIEINNVGN